MKGLASGTTTRRCDKLAPASVLIVGGFTLVLMYWMTGGVDRIERDRRAGVGAGLHASQIQKLVQAAQLREINEFGSGEQIGAAVERYAVDLYLAGNNARQGSVRSDRENVACLSASPGRGPAASGDQAQGQQQEQCLDTLRESHFQFSFTPNFSFQDIH